MKNYLPIVLAALTGPALTQSDSVTLYGVMDLGVRCAEGLNLNHGPAAGSTSGIVSGINSTSRWGLRGMENLGGGVASELQPRIGDWT